MNKLTLSMAALLSLELMAFCGLEVPGIAQAHAANMSLSAVTLVTAGKGPAVDADPCSYVGEAYAVCAN